jgi:hypothetical protein
MELLNSLVDLSVAVYHVIVALIATIVPWTPLIAWVAFWTLAVDWVKLRVFILGGGWLGLLMMMFLAILGWGCIAPPESGSHFVLGLTLSNFVGKTVYVTALAVIALLCGSVQLSGVCGPLCDFTEDEPASGHEDPHGSAHAHGHAH